MEYKKIYFMGNYTIEAAIIMPIIFFIIIAILYSGFYFHDSISIQSSMHSYILENYQNENKNEVLNEFMKYMDSKLIITKINKLDYEADRDGITTHVIYNIDIPFTGLKVFLPNYFGEKEAEVEAENLNKSEFLRKYKVAADLKDME